jgi:quercetin 2,3-dioxygenase
VRVVVGEYDSLVSPLRPPTPVTLLDIRVQKGKMFKHSIPHGWNVFVMMISGSGHFGEQHAAPMQALSFSGEGDHVHFIAEDDAHIILASGKPIDEEIHVAGTFVGNSSLQVYEFQMAYVAGRMGRIVPFVRPKKTN